jgi:hypothetical protein
MTKRTGRPDGRPKKDPTPFLKDPGRFWVALLHAGMTASPKQSIRGVSKAIAAIAFGNEVEHEGLPPEAQRIIKACPPGMVTLVFGPQAPQPVYQRPAVKSDFSPRYVLAAYERELKSVASAHEGVRNVTLHRAAIKLGTFVGAGALASADVESALYQAALASGLPAAGSIKTIKSGLRYGADRPRSIPENRRRAHAF